MENSKIKDLIARLKERVAGRENAIETIRKNGTNPAIHSSQKPCTKHTWMSSSTCLMILSEVRSRVPLSRASIYAKLGKNQFPRPINLGARAVAWRKEDLNAWIAESVSAFTKPAQELEAEWQMENGVAVQAHRHAAEEAEIAAQGVERTS